MKFPNIVTALGWTEEPSTETGLFLQPEELTKINADLGIGATTTEDLATANDSIATLTSAADAAQTAATANINRIATLEAEVARLNGESSGAKGSTTAVIVEETTKELAATGRLPRFDDPNHPANIAAARIGRGVKEL